MVYRTRTYIAADWSGDINAVNQLHSWNDNNNLSLSFTDAHDLTQARDSSLNCSIKSSLSTRLDSSKTFVLIVGSGTKGLRSGSCHLCNSYNAHTYSCARRYNIDYRSYVDYECEMALKAASEGKMKIVILYHAATVDKSKCPDSIKGVGAHIPMRLYNNGVYTWNYLAVKNALV
jgi:hypothetical protein